MNTNQLNNTKLNTHF